MRLIDADALPRSWQPDCNGNKKFVTEEDIAAAPEVSCEACEYNSRENRGRSCTNPHMEQSDDGRPVEFWFPDCDRAFGCSLFEMRSS